MKQVLKNGKMLLKLTLLILKPNPDIPSGRDYATIDRLATTEYFEQG